MDVVALQEQVAALTRELTRVHRGLTSLWRELVEQVDDLDYRNRTQEVVLGYIAQAARGTRPQESAAASVAREQAAVRERRGALHTVEDVPKVADAVTAEGEVRERRTAFRVVAGGVA